MLNDPDLALMGEVILNLRESINAAMDDLAEQNPGISIYKMKDTSGRYIMADLFTTYANAHIAWLNFRMHLETHPEFSNAFKDYLDSTGG